MALSIIVPLADDDALDRELLNLLDQASVNHQVIVSTTAACSSKLPARALQISGPAGRGRQLNRGGRAACGHWLWLVHADSQPEPDALTVVERFIGQSQDALGYCRLRFLPDGPGLVRLNAWGANLRSCLLGLPYGDQGLCLPRNWFERLGGFREDLARGEDLDLVVRARRAGLPMRAIATTLATSARRYRQQGWLRTTLNHQLAAWRLIRAARRSRPPGAP